MDGNIDEQFGERVLKNIVDMFISPEVKRRQDAGELPKPLDLRKAQVILFPDERRSLVRINDEVLAVIKVRYKPSISKKKGDPIFENEIVGLDGVELSSCDDPDCGHIFLMKIGKEWFLSFDFRRNKALGAKHIKRAKEFYQTAKYCLKQGNLAPFVDNLFNAAELSAKALLLVMYDYKPSLRVKARHQIIQTRYSKFVDSGSLFPEYKETLNKLSGLRDSARYLKSPLSITDDTAHNFLNVVKQMIKDTELRLS
ncbi:MAG: HEPN domain-containing protein [Chloroflexota bacterium]